MAGAPTTTTTAADPPAAGIAEATPPSPGYAELEASALARARRLRGIRLTAVAHLLGSEPGGEIALAALALPSAAAGPAPVTVMIEIDGAGFLSSNKARVAAVEVYVYALTDAGRVAAYLAEGFAVDVDAVGQAVWSSGLKFYGRLELGPGLYDLKILVRNAGSGAEGRTATRVRVPAADNREGYPLPPLFAEPAGRDSWQTVMGASLSEAAELGAPLASAGRLLRPAARPVLLAGRSHDAVLYRWGSDRTLPAGWLELIRDGDGAETPATRVALEPGPLEPGPLEPGADPLASPADLVPFRFTVPDLAPGRYRLRLALEGAADTASLSEPISALVAAGHAQDRALLWSDLRWLTGAATEAPAGAAPSPGAAPARTRREAAGRRVRRLSDSYRKAVALLAEGGDGEARQAVFELEAGVLGHQKRDPLPSLRAAELAVARQLGADHPERVLPLAVLHEGLYKLYRERRLFSLVGHTRSVLVALGELHAGLGGPPAQTATIFSSLGGLLQEAYLPEGSRALFARALEHLEGQPAALLGLALAYEKQAQYGQAVDYLERLVAAQPQAREARLRLAVNLARLGERRRFAELLAELVTAGPDDWVTALAYERLARFHLETGAGDRAIELLEEAVERMPAGQSLRHLLAHAYDRRGRAHEALATLERIEARPGGGPSARLRYDSWANQPLTAARAELAAAAARAATASKPEPEPESGG